MKKLLFIGTPLALVAGIAIAFLAVWAWGAGSGGPTEAATIQGIVEYTVYDASGNLKEHKVIRNATSNLFVNDARDRVGSDGVTLNAVAAGSETTAYDNIILCAINLTSAALQAAPCGTLVTAGNVGLNPKDGAAAVDTVADATGNYLVSWSFTVANASVTIEAIQLSKGVVVDGATTNQSVGAFQDVTLTLGIGDTVEFKWTIDLDLPSGIGA